MSLTTKNIANKINAFFASPTNDVAFIFIVTDSDESLGGHTYWRDPIAKTWVDRDGAVRSTEEITGDALAYFTSTDRDEVRKPYIGSLGTSAGLPYVYDGNAWVAAFGNEEESESGGVTVQTLGVLWLDVHDADEHLMKIFGRAAENVSNPERVTTHLIDVQVGPDLAVHDVVYGFHLAGYRDDYYTD
jgi:hypothetical protein